MPSTIRSALVLVLTVGIVGCGGSSRPRGVDAGSSDGGSGDASRADAGRDGGGADGGTVTCEGAPCGSGELCCMISCEGAMGCATAESGMCPLLGCPPLPETTPCGADTCSRATEICVEGNFGGPTRSTCEAVPAGCEADRSCACVAATYCTAGLAMCTDVSDNHVFCETGFD